MLDYKREILREYRSEESALRYFNIVKSFPIVYEKNGKILGCKKPIKSNLKANETFRKPFINSKKRFQYKLDILTEEVLLEAV